MLHKKYQTLFRRMAQVSLIVLALLSKEAKIALIRIAAVQRIGGQRLDPLGRGVGFRAFHDYMVQVLVDYDTDVAAQEMIVEQFIAPWMWHFLHMCPFGVDYRRTLSTHKAEASLARALLSSGAWQRDMGAVQTSLV